MAVADSDEQRVTVRPLLYSGSVLDSGPYFKVIICWK